MPQQSHAARADGDRTTVVVRGDLDIDADRALHHTLSTALAGSARGIDVDMSGVGFCDCAGLNVLLEIRLLAREQSKTVTVRAASPAVHRILTLTGTLPLFEAEPEPEPEPDRSLLEGEVRAGVASPHLARRTLRAPYPSWPAALSPPRTPGTVRL
ncbi:STAS domain-containing protein [Streptomyces sp. NPDC026672]|uniref:STAS domain-containing protein n=1 Tax=unclassified Streptomyces TaxID=2593676 RepID=UPI0033FC75B2